MKKIVLAVVCFFAFSLSSFGLSVPEYLQQVSVTIHTSHGQGSGTLINRDGESFVWSAAHVVSSCRHVRAVVDPANGTTVSIVTFDPVLVVKEIYQNGKSVGMISLDADIIRYSDADFGEDLTLLHIRKPGMFLGSVVFSLTDEVPAIGTKIFHCGSLLGQMGSNSVTTGVISQVGRSTLGTYFDQTDAAIFSGSSGGSIHDAKGLYLGMVVRSCGAGFSIVVPVRRMHAYAKRAGVEWAMDYAVPVTQGGNIEILSEEAPAPVSL